MWASPALDRCSASQLRWEPSSSHLDVAYETIISSEVQKTIALRVVVRCFGLSIRCSGSALESVKKDSIIQILCSSLVLCGRRGLRAGLQNQDSRQE